MSKFWERVFYVMTFITQGSSYMSPRTYAILHRLHHAYTDTEDDPHSPMHSKGFLSLMNRTRKKYADVFNGRLQVEEKFTRNIPDWAKFDRMAHPWFMRVIWLALYTMFYVYFATSPWQYLLIPVHAMIGPIHGGIINWFAHKYGSTNFKVNNTSKNLFPIDVLMLGEAYHNNHHKFPGSINFGVKWNEIDPIYFTILFFHKLRIVRINKLPRTNDLF